MVICSDFKQSGRRNSPSLGEFVVVSKQREHCAANEVPPSYTSNAAITKADYIAALAKDKGQCLPDGSMPAKGEQIVQHMELQIGAIKSPVDLSKTWDAPFVAQAHKDLGIN